jgi:hypothetical protein
MNKTKGEKKTTDNSNYACLGKENRRFMEIVNNRLFFAGRISR